MPYLSFLDVKSKFIELKARQHAREEPHYWTVWESKLHSNLYYSERIAFLSLFCFITFVAVVGNLLTLYVVATR
jgi:hypothetical protein